MTLESFKVGEYEVNPNTRSIQINGENVQLQPRVMDLLCYLSQNANKVISRDELVQHVWKGSVVSDDAIHRIISILRSVLKDDSKNPKYLETIPKTGYRLIASVEISKPYAPIKYRFNLYQISTLILLLFISSFYFLTSKSTNIKNVVPKFRYLTSHNGLEYAPKFSPNTHDVLYSQFNKDWQGSYIINSNIASSAKKLNIDNHNIDTIWSPTGNSIYSHEATADSCRIMKHYLSGLPSQYISDCLTKRRGMFFYMNASKDEKYLVVSERDSNTPRQIYQIDIDSGDRKPFFTKLEGIGDYFPKYSPDNKWIAFARGFTANSRELMIVPAIGGTPKQLTFDDSPIQDLAWTSNNGIVFISNRESGITGLWHIKLDGSEPTWLNIIVDSIDQIDISYDDQYLAYQNWYQPFNVFKVKLEQINKGIEKRIALTDSKKENIFPSLSPDGKKLIYASNQTGEYDLWVSNPDGSNAKLLVENVLKYAAPEWSPDSKQVSFSLLNEGQGDVCITNLEGQYSCINNSMDDELFPTWSMNQQQVYFTQMIAGEPAKYINFKYDLVNRSISKTDYESAINVKHDDIGNIYFNEAVSSKIYRINAQNQQKELLIDDFYDVYYKAWHLAKSGIYYYSKNKEFRYYNFKTKQVKTLAPSSKVGGYGTTGGLFVDRDEQNIYFSLSPMTLNGDIGLVENFSDLLPPN